MARYGGPVADEGWRRPLGAGGRPALGHHERSGLVRLLIEPRFPVP